MWCRRPIGVHCCCFCCKTAFQSSPQQACCQCSAARSACTAECTLPLIVLRIYSKRSALYWATCNLRAEWTACTVQHTLPPLVRGHSGISALRGHAAKGEYNTCSVASLPSWCTLLQLPLQLTVRLLLKAGLLDCLFLWCWLQLNSKPLGVHPSHLPGGRQHVHMCIAKTSHRWDESCQQIVQQRREEQSQGPKLTAAGPGAHRGDDCAHPAACGHPDVRLRTGGLHLACQGNRAQAGKSVPSGMCGAAVKSKLHPVQRPIPAAPWTSWQHGCSAWAVQLSKPRNCCHAMHSTFGHGSNASLVAVHLQLVLQGSYGQQSMCAHPACGSIASFADADWLH